MVLVDLGGWWWYVLCCCCRPWVGFGVWWWCGLDGVAWRVGLFCRGWFCLLSTVLECFVMLRMRMIGVALLSVFVLGVVGAASASAAELPEFETERAGTSKSNAVSSLSSGVGNIECKKLTDETGKGKKSGTFTIDFTKCSAPGLGKGSECHSLGDEKSTILTGGTWELVPGPSQTPKALILFKVTPVHLECKNEKGTQTLLQIVLGNVLGTITPLNTSSLLFEINVKTTTVEGTVQEFEKWENDSGGMETAKLLVQLNGTGSFQAGGELATNDEVVMLVGETKIVK